MFENIRSELRRLDQSHGGTTIPIQMPLDDGGYFDRRCPSAVCESDFKVLFEDWKDKVSEIRVFCPICREEAKATEWNTPQQCEYIREVAIQHLRGVVDKALAQDARDFNSQQRPGFIQLSLSYRPGVPTLMVPISAAEELRQEFTCEQCGCRYSSLGAAFFCPACEHNSAETTSSQTMETVRQSLAALPAIRKAVESSAGLDAAENAVRQILENDMVRVVGAFQRATEGLFERVPGAVNISRRKNVFQSLAEGSALWRQVSGKGYENLLSAGDMADLLRFFQQRHLLAHCEGVVDQDYINRSGDRTYSVGRRLVIREEAVGRAVDLALRLTNELKKMV